MRILADENIPNITVHELRALGHDVLDIRGAERQGMFDDELWPLAQKEQRIHARIMAAFRQFSEREWPGLLVVMRDAVQSVHRA